VISLSIGWIPGFYGELAFINAERLRNFLDSSHLNSQTPSPADALSPTRKSDHGCLHGESCAQ